MKDDDGRVHGAPASTTGRHAADAGRAGDARCACRTTGARCCETFGIAAPEEAFPTLQDALQYPTLNVRGLASAFVGAGARTIIPDRATAAIDIRLVKETRAARPDREVRAHVRKRGLSPRRRRSRTTRRARRIRASPRSWRPATATNAFRTSPLDPQARRVAAALERSSASRRCSSARWAARSRSRRSSKRSGFPAVLVPTVNFDNNQHEENENLRLGHSFRPSRSSRRSCRS